MLPALRTALTAAGAEEESAVQLRQVIFITDGAVGNEVELFEAVSALLGDHRLFTVGIGSAPNSWFMRKAAQFGRGTHTHIGNLDEVDEKMSGLFEQLARPAATDLAVTWPAPVDAWPKRIPDLYRGHPLLVAVRFGDAPPAGDIQITGRLAGQPWHTHVQTGTPTVSEAGEVGTPIHFEVRTPTHSEVRTPTHSEAGTPTHSEAGTPTYSQRGTPTYSAAERPDGESGTPTPSGSLARHRGVAALWARHKIAGLLDEIVDGRSEEAVRAEVLPLALKHQLLSPYTSFVAVEEAVSRPADAGLDSAAVPNTRPRGQASQPFAYPRTATSGPARLWAGVLLLFLAMMVRVMRQPEMDHVAPARA
jgi:hypothetical protein